MKLILMRIFENANSRHALSYASLVKFVVVVIFAILCSLQQLFQVESGLILDVVQKGEKGLAYSFNC